MKIIILPIMLFQFLLASDTVKNYFDFGVHGFQYEIAEENGNDIIHKKLKELDVSSVVSSMKKDMFSAFVGQSSLPSSDKNLTITKLDEAPARWDVKDLNGVIIKRKGEMIVSSIPNGASFSLCFIDGSDEEQVVKIVLEEFKACTYMVANMNVNTFESKYGFRAFPMGRQNDMYVNRFNVKSLPVKITKIGSNITTKTLDILAIRKKFRKDANE